MLVNPRDFSELLFAGAVPPPASQARAAADAVTKLTDRDERD